LLENEKRKLSEDLEWQKLYQKELEKITAQSRADGDAYMKVKEGEIEKLRAKIKELRE
jgi:hypothetical protein